MPFHLLNLEHDASVAILRITSGKLNAISPELLEELHRVLDDLEPDSELRGLIITGAESRFFSFGLDVPRLLSLSRPELDTFMAGFERLLDRFYTFPHAVGAAVNGHATAGGLLLALTADCRVGAEGAFSIGLSEVKLGLAAPPSALRLMRRRLGASVTSDLALRGLMVTPEGARDLGIFETIVPGTELLRETLTRVRALAGTPPGAIALNKRFLAGGVFDFSESVLKQERSAWLDAWFASGTQTELRKLTERK